MVDHSPYFYPWGVDSIAQLVGYENEPIYLDGLINTFMDAHEQPPSFGFTTALLYMHINKSGGVWGDGFNSNFCQSVLTLCENTVATESKEINKVWSNMWVLLLPSGQSVFGCCPSCSIKGAREQFPHENSTSFILIDIGSLYRSMSDFLALKAVGI
jgi:hypothetical protein